MRAGIHFLDFFNDPRIIREQRIAANWVIEGGGLVRVEMNTRVPYLYSNSGEGASFTQRMISSISVNGSISPEGFLLLVLLLVVIIVTVVVVDGVSLILKLLFAIIACVFRDEEMPSLISCRMAAKVMVGVSDVDVLLGGILSTKDNAAVDDILKYHPDLIGDELGFVS
ncbi:hypothetical protein Tco_0992281 [Tanacetum coccineum]|uniref:Uncharacterized protein n=1 Tax=Tanacetum coccineum TaxID=301880 RepID=A0ABQ5F1Y9_9ASTR